MNKGYLIAFTGIDGSGKTTHAELLVKSLKESGVNVSQIWSGWNPFFLRFLIKRWQKRKGNTVSSNKGAYRNSKTLEGKRLLNNLFFRWIWLSYFFVDYGLQLFVKIRLSLMRRRTVISDRIFYDIIIDQAVNLGDRKDWLLNSLDSLWMNLLFPKPDLVIYVDCPPDIAFLRKKEDLVEALVERRKL